jgi:hypothetical protein
MKIKLEEVERYERPMTMRLAFRFGVNQGRVNEVLKGKRHPGSERIAREKRDFH